MAKPQFQDLVQMFARSIAQFGPRDALGTRRGGRWVWTSYAELGKQVDDFRAGLASLGLKRGERVAIVSNNRVEWAVAAYACYGLGATLVPVFEAQDDEERAYIVKDCEASVIIAANRKIYEECLELKKSAASVRHVIGLALPDTDPLSYRGVLAAGAAAPVAPIAPSPDDIVVFIYTSGTTGKPKGVPLSHANITSNLTAIHELLQLTPEDRSLSFLPWAHAFGHTCELHWLLSTGSSIAICDSLERLVEELGEVRPTILLSVPRIFIRVHTDLQKQLIGKPAFVKHLLERGIRAALRKRAGQALGLVDSLAFAVTDRLVFSRIRDKLGGRLRYAVSGGAALPRDVAELIDALGIDVFAGYGLSETSPLVSVNTKGSQRIGSVGKPVPGVKVLIDKDVEGAHEHGQGEVIVVGPNVMKGYHHRDEDTRKAMTEEGGFRTGDLGYLDGDGFLFVVGRLKEQYKLENGRYVVPGHVEEELKQSPYIQNAMVYGEGRPYNVALIVADTDALAKWAKEEAGLSFSGTKEMLRSERVKEHLLSEVERCSRELEPFEKIRDITLADEEFTAENGLLTHTLKLKRSAVWEKYGKRILALYDKRGS